MTPTHKTIVGWRTRRLLAVLGVLTMLLASCEKKPQAQRPFTPRPGTVPPATQTAGADAPAALGSPTGTFLDRHEQADLRLVSYNIWWNSVFEDVSPANAAKFVRVIRALNPDILALQEVGVAPNGLPQPAGDRSAKAVVQLMNKIAPLPGGPTWHAHQGKDNVIVSKYPLKMAATDTIPPGERQQAIALVDLPDDRFAIDFYVLNNHYRCCGGEDNDPIRQQQSDAIAGWIRDARTPGGNVDLPAGTALAVVGDLNIVGGFQPVQTLLDGNIIDEELYGADFPPDWDDTAMVDAHPLHNIDGPDDYTWRNDNDQWDPGRLDFIIYTDSMLQVVKKFVLNTTIMTEEDLRAAGLHKFDVTVDDVGKDYDHLPLVVDFRVE